METKEKPQQQYIITGQVIAGTPTKAKHRNQTDPLKVTHHKVVPFEPGRIIERCGKRYMLMRDGSQRRLVQETMNRKPRAEA